MTDTAGPFDGAPWAEAQWARHAAAWAPSGVYGPPAASTTTGDLPLSVSGRSVGLGAGRAWVRGFGFERSGAAMQDPGANTHASFSRRDRIVLRRNLATHAISQVVIQGTPAASPTPPDLSQSETGSWDLPMFSFLVPPNSGTSITGIVDERGWLNGSGSLEVPSIAVRDAHFPSPTKGQACIVGGVPHTHDGTKWKYSHEAPFEATTDAGGNLVIPHGLGVAPATAFVTPGNQLSALLNNIVSMHVTNSDATNLVVYVRRDDTNAGLPFQTVRCFWRASV